MKSSSAREATKMERKTLEKNRRILMKNLCMKLASLIPKQHCASTKDMLSQQDHLDQATSYIKTLRARIEKMKERRGQKMNIQEMDIEIESGATSSEFKLPVIEIRHQDSYLEVVLVSGQEKRFMFHEVISILEEEGAQVINANFSIVGEKIFYTLHSQAVSSRLGLDASRVTERLNQLIR
ncbi:transcription factor bHLH162-like [Curcuma longa]|uniref:transcription factor bHLH162-like n=1 Tax=Curcuma longa TaxID=136217 RepID=UPI003D9E4A15